MENSDRELIKRFLVSDVKLKRLYAEHEALEAKLSSFENRTFLAADEEVELKRLKTKKLRGVDQMMRIVAERKRELMGEAQFV